MKNTPKNPKKNRPKTWKQSEFPNGREPKGSLLFYKNLCQVFSKNT